MALISIHHTSSATAKVASVMIALPMNWAISTWFRRRRTGPRAERNYQPQTGRWRRICRRRTEPSESGSPDAAHAVHRNRADGIVNAQPFEQFDAADYDDHAGDRRRAGWSRSG